MNRLQEAMEHRLGRLVMNDPRRLARSAYPPLNLWEDDDNLYVEAELPELEVTDLEIFVKGDNELSIKGERKQPELGKGTWHRRERGHGGFSRVGELPQYVDGDKVTAEFRHGVLTITLPNRIQARCVDHHVAQTEGSPGATNRGQSHLILTAAARLPPSASAGSV
jgi:HSP20 family protein